MEQRLVEEETAKRIEEMVKKRVEEELEKRKEEIEQEVLRRIEEAKREMEKEMMEEMERRRQVLLEEEKKRQVRTFLCFFLENLTSTFQVVQDHQCRNCIIKFIVLSLRSQQNVFVFKELLFSYQCFVRLLSLSDLCYCLCV